MEVHLKLPLYTNAYEIIKKSNFEKNILKIFYPMFP